LNGAKSFRVLQALGFFLLDALQMSSSYFITTIFYVYGFGCIVMREFPESLSEGKHCLVYKHYANKIFVVEHARNKLQATHVAGNGDLSS